MKAKMLLKKSLVGILSAACVVSMIPQGILAQEDVLTEMVFEDESAYDVVFEDQASDELVYDNTDSVQALETDEAMVTEVNVAEDTVEADDAPSTTAYTLGKTVSDTLAKEYDSSSHLKYNVYEFTLKEAGRIKLTTESDGINWYLSCKLKDYYSLSPEYDHKDRLWNLEFGKLFEEAGYDSDDEDPITTETTLDLIAGTYYLYAVPYLYPMNDPITYSFATTYDPIKYNNKTEITVFDTKVFGSNNTYEESTEIVTDQMYVAQSTTDNWDRTDWYTFRLDKPSSLYLTASTEEIDKLEFRMYRYNPIGDPVLLSWEPSTPIEIGTQVLDKKALPIKSVENNELIDRSDYYSSGHTEYEDGLYYLSVNKKAGDQKEVCKTGWYRFKLLTKKKAAKPLTEVQILDGKTVVSTSKKAATGKINIALNQEKNISVNILPTDADEQTFTWEIDDPKIANIDVTTGEMILKPVAAGECNLTVTTDGVDKNGETLTTSCAIVVREEATEKACPTVITKQKVDLTGEEFFGSAIDKKNEKLLVVDPDTADDETPTKSKLGVVSKVGLFTAKSPGKVTVLRMYKVGKNDYEETARITFDIETPVINYPILDNGNRAKNFTFVKAGVVYNTADFISTTSEQKPTFTSSDKKNKISELSTLGGMFVMLKSGTVKLTASYGEGKNAAKYTIVIKASYPNIPAKLTVKEDQTKVVKVKNVQPGLTPQWYAVEKVADGQFTTTDVFEVEPADESGMSVYVTGLEAGDALLAVTVDGANYFCEVHVK